MARTSPRARAAMINLTLMVTLGSLIAVPIVFASLAPAGFAPDSGQRSADVSTIFTYQGSLDQGGEPVDATYQFRFRLYDAAAAGNQIGVEAIRPFVEVVAGRFSVTLDFGVDAFAAGGERWLEIEVEGVTLEPRQRITAAPFAITTRGIFVDADGNVGLGTTSPNARLDVHSEARVSNATGNVRVQQFIDPSDAGYIRTYGPNGNLNFEVARSLANPNNGAMVVVNEANTATAGFAAAGGPGNSSFVFADTATANVKNFRMPHPHMENMEIVYACIEGPEAAAYVRGTARLINGRALVPFPDHFVDVINADSLTVQLTPRSATSRGLAVIEQNHDGFIVQELMEGNGNYEFHWHATAVRRGYEDYQVIQPRLDLMIQRSSPRDEKGR